MVAGPTATSPERTVDALRRLIGTRGRRVLVGVTLLLGLLAAIGVTAGTPIEERSLGVVANPVQSLMSVLTPFSTVLLSAALLADDRQADPDRQVDPGRQDNSGRRVALAPTWAAAAGYGILIGVWGSLVSLVATLIGSGSLDRAPTIIVAGPIVQVIACGVGAAFGVLIRPAWLAMVATIVIPLGVWALLGLAGLSAAQGWLTPYAAVIRVFAAPMTPLAWVQWLVVALIWAVGLNAAAFGRVRANDAR